MQSETAIGWHKASWLVKTEDTMAVNIHVELVMSKYSGRVDDVNNTHGFSSFFHTAKIHHRGTQRNHWT